MKQWTSLLILKVILFTMLLSYNSLYAQENKEEFTIYLTANLGLSEPDGNTILKNIANANEKEKNAALLLLGNSFRRKNVSNDFGAGSQSLSDSHMDVINNFTGKVFAIPGTTEWKTKGFVGVDSLEKRLQGNSKAKFIPNDGCPFEKEKLNDQIELVVVDTEWFLQGRKNNPSRNEECNVNNEAAFFLEFADDLKKEEGKIKIVAIYHPVYTYTKQGFIGNVGAFAPNDFYNKRYREMRQRLEVIARQFDNVILVSGHDRNLQYIQSFGVPQIISGASGKTAKTKDAAKEDFSSNGKGYAKLHFDKKGNVDVSFYDLNKNGQKPVFEKRVLQGTEEKFENSDFQDKASYGKTQSASVYQNEDVKKSGFHKFLFGEHYRKLYGQKVDAPVAFIDTLMGGLKPIRGGGGQQTRSLRLVDNEGQEYVLRALEKSTTRFLQANLSQTAYIGNRLDDTAIDDVLYDFYTTANPYTPYAIPLLSSEVEILHTNPRLLYVPKQEALARYNADFGNELYLFEEHVGDTQTEVKSFDDPDDILDTEDVFEEILESGKSIVDEPSYIRARLFDMLIGDWDRHPDQWRWALFKRDDGTEYCIPIPRDRDNAFPKYDGSLIVLLTRIIPNLRKMQSFEDDIRNVKWFNQSPYHLDIALAKQSVWEEWERQAKYLQNNLSDSDIDLAFQNIPDNVQGATFNTISKKLKARRDNIVKIAKRYFDHLGKFAIVTGTQKNDTITIDRLTDGKTMISIQSEDARIFQKTYDKDLTKEIWIYGLNGEDVFQTRGDGNRPIKIKVLGGRDHDIYNFRNSRKIKLYDYKGRDNTKINNNSKQWLVDDYEVNAYSPKKVKVSANQILPVIGFNPDDGLEVGVVDIYTYNGIQSNPFTQQHRFSGSYYTASTGFNLEYKGEFAQLFHQWNLGLEARYSSPNYARNFFGFGNETEYDRDAVDLNFNRTRTQRWKAAIALLWKGQNGGYFSFKPLFESFKVERTDDRFVESLPVANAVFERQNYGGLEVAYGYDNKDSGTFPRFGSEAGLTVGYKTILDAEVAENEFFYVRPNLGFVHKITRHGALVFATQLGGTFIFGDDFEFYHAASLGGNLNLRGFRNERFTGKYSAYHNLDLRMVLGGVRTSIIPFRYGITGSFDYGRVWLKNDSSNIWHNSVGGSLWASSLGKFATNLGYFTSTDGGRVVFSLGFTF